MNILFISKLSGNLWAGPNNSVPAQVNAQSDIDNVFWYNLNQVKRPGWDFAKVSCKNLNDYPTGRLHDLPAPFNVPDIVVFEECYAFGFEPIIKDVQNKQIPYVIIPRSSLTSSAQRNKAWKKKIGNILYYNSFINKAAGIHYLTESEKIDSEGLWNTFGYVIPNGTLLQTNTKNSFSNNGIIASYVGRIEINQKGLDLLMEAIVVLKDELRQNNFSLNLYGPDRDGSVGILDDLIKKNNINDLVKINEGVFGEEKQNVLLGTDVFIMTSRFEGLPMGLIEALSYGVPCVATKGTYMADEIINYDAGWSAENNVNSIVKALKRMLNDKQKFSVKGQSAVKLAEAYSWTSIAQRTHDMFDRIIKNAIE